MRWLRAVGAVTAALVLLVVITIGALVGLNAECNGSTTDCPRPAIYRYTLVALPLVSLALLVAGGAWSIRRRSLQPLVIGEGAVLTLALVVDSMLR